MSSAQSTSLQAYLPITHCPLLYRFVLRYPALYPPIVTNVKLPVAEEVPRFTGRHFVIGAWAGYFTSLEASAP